MFYEDQQVKTISLRGTFNEFLVFFRNLGKFTVLMAQRLSLQCTFVDRDVHKTDLWVEFNEIVCGFVDIYRLLKKKLPKRKAKKFNQSNLTRDLLGQK